MDGATYSKVKWGNFGNLTFNDYNFRLQYVIHINSSTNNTDSVANPTRKVDPSDVSLTAVESERGSPLSKITPTKLYSRL